MSKRKQTEIHNKVKEIKKKIKGSNEEVKDANQKRILKKVKKLTIRKFVFALCFHVSFVAFYSIGLWLDVSYSRTRVYIHTCSLRARSYCLFSLRTSWLCFARDVNVPEGEREVRETEPCLIRAATF